MLYDELACVSTFAPMNNLPASQLFDPAGHGVTSGYTDLFVPYLGPPPREQKMTPYAKKSTAVWNMPESYMTESEVLRDTVEDWMLTANQTWYTERIMPWFMTDDIHIQWEQWENNAHYMGITPHQAPSNVTTQKRTIRRANMVRRGIAAEFEHDFVATARGRTSFIASLAQIGRSVQETANVEVLRSLLGCHTYQQVYLRKYGIIKQDDLDGWLNHKAQRFMIAQKETFGLEILNTQIEQEQEQYQAFANVWLLGREVMDYCSLVPEGKIFYFLGGQEAVDRVNGRSQNGTALAGTMGNVRSLQPPRMISETPVYLVKSYFVDGIGALELLSRTVEVGVFNTMIDCTRDYSEYRSSNRNIRVYDNDRDDWAEIKLEDAIAHCINWDEGSAGDIHNPFVGRYSRNKAESPLDVEYDFLRYGTGEGNPNGYFKQDVSIIGDFDAKWLTRAQCENAGEALYHQLLRNGHKAAVESVGAGTGFGSAGEAIKSILGVDNFFFRTDAQRTATSHGTTKATDTLTSLTALDKFAAVKTPTIAPLASAVPPTAGAAPSAGAPTAEDVQKWEGKHLRERLGIIVPQSHKDQLERIASAVDQPWQQRAEAIEKMCVQLKTEDPQTIPQMGDVDRMRTWIAAANKQFEEGLRAKLTAASSQTPSRTQQSAAPVAGDVEYFPIGTPLPAGYRYASVHDEIKANGPAKQCPTSLRDFPHLAHLWAETEGSAAQGDGAQAMGGRRRGFAPIEAEQGRGELEKQSDGTFVGAGRTTEERQKILDLRNARLAKRYQNLEDRVKAISQGGAPIVIKWLAILWCGTVFARASLERLCLHNVPLGCNFLLLRPHATYRTRYGIKCAANGKSGYTFFGHSDMQLEHEAARKVGMMHYTAYLAAIVTNPKNVYVVEDLYCQKYLGGMGVKFWRNAKEYINASGKRTLKSIICTMLPANMREHRIEQKLDIRGRWHTAHEIQLISDHTYSQVCYPGGARTALIMGWWDAHRRGKGPGSQVVQRGVDMNYVCWQGVQWHVNPKDQSWGDVIVEQGNFASKVYPGCGQVRNGQYKFLETPTYLATTSLARH